MAVEDEVGAAEGRDGAGGDAPGPKRSVTGRYPWVVMGVVLAGSYLVVLDTTVLGIALAAIARDLRAEQSIGIDWVVTSYLIAVGIVQPATGWMADRWGRKGVYSASLLLFTVASAVAGVAPNLPVLVMARVVQGLGGGAMMPVGMAMIYELFPPRRRGSALGVWGIAIMAAPMVGPPVGGWLVATASWRWIFLVNVPIGVVALVLARTFLRDIGFRERRPLHWQGWVLAAYAMVAVVVGSREGTTWGWGSPVALLVFGTALAALAALVAMSLRHPAPLIDFRMFGVRTFTLTNALTAMVTVAMFSRLAFLPVELQVVRHLGADRVGLLLVPPAVAVACTMPIGGWLADRIGSRLPVAAGLTALAASTWELAHLDPRVPESRLLVILVLGGLGTGLSLMPTTVAAMNSTPQRWIAQATTVNSLNRQVAAALGTALLASLVVARLGAVAPTDLRTAAELARAQDAYNFVFMVAFVFTTASAVLALFLPGSAGPAKFQDARAAEHEQLHTAMAV